VKAFLSHSSVDKEFVSSVAKELGRQYCIYDDQAFSSGIEFKQSIENSLDDSSVFVLFASAEALKSVWVTFEVSEAWYKKLLETLSRALVYIIDSSVTVSDLPEWLRRAKVERATSYKTVARDIRSHIDDVLRSRQHPFFVGRTDDTAALQQALMPIDGSIPPHAVFVTGLPGVGRRSLIRNGAPPILNLRKFVEVRVGEGDSINDLCAAVASLVEAYSTSEGLKHIVDTIQRLSEQEALDRLMTNLRLLIAGKELPILLDEGGLLDSEGHLRAPITALLRALHPNDEAYLFMVSIRRPQLVPDISVPIIHISPLQSEDAKRLVLMLAQRSELSLKPAELSELADYVAGYPPAAYFAVQQAEQYGIELVMNDKVRLVQFRTQVFLRHFAKLAVRPEAVRILSLLSVYSPLPLPVIAETLELDIRELQPQLVNLIDLALVITTPHGHFRIADPVAEAAKSTFNLPTEPEHKRLARQLLEYVERAEIDTAQLELSRVLFRAARFANDKKTSDAAIHFANDLIQLTESLYHAKRYEEAVSMGLVAVAERPDNVAARSFLIRALIQQELWEQANGQIAELRKVAPPRDIAYLTGFLERKRGNLSAAIAAYEQATRLGRNDAAITREMALCYFLAGRDDEALRRIHAALKQHSDNRYVVDLWAQVATRLRDEDAARQALSRLEVMDKEEFYYHRLSRIEQAFGRQREALMAARKAASYPNPSFEILSQLVVCETEFGDVSQAEDRLSSLDRRSGNTRRDVRTGLRCRLDIAKGNYKGALDLSERISDKSTYFYKKIRRDAIDGELHSSVLNDETRRAYELELSELDADLADVAIDAVLPFDSDAPS
jgi:tetratricopeptide (TPR) repeat protein